MNVKPLVFGIFLGLTSTLASAQVSLNSEQESTDTTFNASFAVDEPYDPFEGFNRVMFGFNHHLDRFILKPVAKGYRAVTPNRVENGVTNVFSNLTEVRNLVNNIFQWKWKKAGNSTGRFLVNSTVGIVGIFDVAKNIGLPKLEGEDFGQTMAAWGVGQGPYLVLPLLGPSTVRDSVGTIADFYVDPVVYIEDDDAALAAGILRTVNTRAQLLSAEELVSGDRYAFFRNAYLQRREYLINDGKVEDEFGSEAEDLEDFEFQDE
ncbi:MlaA family lipoprotein [Sessilibacter sp. MAH4]